ncbi:DNA repair protein RecN [Aerococcaceae bacterium WGS1372]
MLQSLTIENFAIIEKVSIDFSEGMTVLSGETGAGKSIIIDALGILCGGRGSAEFIRQEDEKLFIEGLFAMDKVPDGMHQALTDYGLELDIEADDLLIRREIYRSGRNIIRINGQLANVSLLKKIGSYLVDIHGQNEHQDLLDRSKHLSLLDSYGRDILERDLNAYDEAYNKYRDIRKQWLQVQKSETDDRQRVNFLEFQIKEIEDLQLVEGEDEELEAISRQLQHAQLISQNLSLVNQLISDSDESILHQIEHILTALNEIKEYQDNIKTISEGLSSIQYELEEFAHQLATIDSQVEQDDQNIDQVESRLMELSQIKRKFGLDIQGILEYYNEISEEVYQIQHRDRYLQELESNLLEAYNELLGIAERLNEKRQLVAEELVQAIEHELKDVYMENSRFSVRFTDIDIDNELALSQSEKLIKFYPTSFNQLEFYVSTNVGEKHKSLVQVASGGELSRFMLALKTVFSRKSHLKVMVFDEIDTGVSGRVGQAIAEKMCEIANYHQLLCITHLAQVSAISDQQLFIYKEVTEGQTSTNVKQLTYDERIEAIANMLSGRELTQTSMDMATELLNNQKKS